MSQISLLCADERQGHRGRTKTDTWQPEWRRRSEMGRRFSGTNASRWINVSNKDELNIKKSFHWMLLNDWNKYWQDSDFYFIIPHTWHIEQWWRGSAAVRAAALQEKWMWRELGSRTRPKVRKWVCSICVNGCISFVCPVSFVCTWPCNGLHHAEGLIGLPPCNWLISHFSRRSNWSGVANNVSFKWLPVQPWQSENCTKTNNATSLITANSKMKKYTNKLSCQKICNVMFLPVR